MVAQVSPLPARVASPGIAAAKATIASISSSKGVVKPTNLPQATAKVASSHAAMMRGGDIVNQGSQQVHEVPVGNEDQLVLNGQIVDQSAMRTPHAFCFF